MKAGEATINLIRTVCDGDLAQTNSTAQKLRETTTLEDLGNLGHWLSVWGFEW